MTGGGEYNKPPPRDDDMPHTFADLIELDEGDSDRTERETRK